jgi:hypothetical protein
MCCQVSQLVLLQYARTQTQRHCLNHRMRTALHWARQFPIYHLNTVLCFNGFVVNCYAAKFADWKNSERDHCAHTLIWTTAFASLSSSKNDMSNSEISTMNSLNCALCQLTLEQKQTLRTYSTRKSRTHCATDTGSNCWRRLPQRQSNPVLLIGDG